MAKEDIAPLLRRAVHALERIAVALERFEPAAPEPCAHPQSEREIVPTSTMGSLCYRCKACGEEFS